MNVVYTEIFPGRQLPSRCCVSSPVQSPSLSYASSNVLTAFLLFAMPLASVAKLHQRIGQLLVNIVRRSSNVA